MSAILWGSWGLLFLGAELYAVINKSAMWQPLSDFVWQLESYGAWVKLIFLFGIAVLLVHIVAKFP